MQTRSIIPRRCGIERRHFKYSEHVPERRNGQDRRCGLDRRDYGSMEEFKVAVNATA